MIVKALILSVYELFVPTKATPNLVFHQIIRVPRVKFSVFIALEKAHWEVVSLRGLESDIS